MGDTVSAKNHQKFLRNQHISHSRYDSTAFSRLKGEHSKRIVEVLIKSTVNVKVAKQMEAAATVADEVIIKQKDIRKKLLQIKEEDSSAPVDSARRGSQMK